MGEKERLAQLETVRRERAEYGDLLDVLEHIWKAKSGLLKKLRLKRLDKETVNKRLAEGEVLLRLEELPLDAPELLAYAREIETVFRRKGMLGREPLDLEGCLKMLREENADILEQDRWKGPEGETVRFILVETVKPLYEKYGKIYSRFFDETQWQKPHCYICGAPPNMAKTEGTEGRKYLHCAMCDVSWYYPLVKCPYCGNDDPAKLAEIEMEDDALYKVDACRKCKKYIKVVDARLRQGEIVFELEDILSALLDFIAQKEGFTA